MLKIQNLSIQDATLFIRCDFNVPLDEFGNIRDDRRIRESLPTIHYALDHNCKIILASHLGRPKGKPDPKLSLLPVARRLTRLLDMQVLFAHDPGGEDSKQKAAKLKNGEILLLENLRFDPGETANDPQFAKKLADLATFYVNDAFGVCHRAHASVEAITHYFDTAHKGAGDTIESTLLEQSPKNYANTEFCSAQGSRADKPRSNSLNLTARKGAGFLLQKEINFFHDVLQKPPHPFTLIVGGSKVSTKLGALKHLLPEIDKMLIGGGMAFTFLKALGYETGRSIVEEDLIEEARGILHEAKTQKVKIFLPVDFIVAKEMQQETKSKVVTYQDIPDDYMGLDIGPATLQLFEEATQKAKIILWNGPMGVFEIDKFAQGSLNLARYIATLHATKIIGGGDTGEMIHKAGVIEKMTFVSTGGGASLELLQGKELPGIKALD